MLAKLNMSRVIGPVFVLYAVEFLDEFIYGLHGAILPTLKTDLALTYTQVGLLLSLPNFIAVFAEPIIGLIGDTRYRRWMVLGGIVATFAGLMLVAASQSFASVLIAFVIMAPASGAYVNLSQASLIERDSTRAEQTMARWVLVGSAAVAVAPLIVTAALYLSLGWRGLYWGLAGLAACFIAMLWPQKFDLHAGSTEESVSPRKLAAMFVEGLRNRELLRWILLTEVADFLLDKHTEVIGLYFHDVVGVSLAAASGVVAWSSLIGLIATVALVPLIEKVSGLSLLRGTAIIVLAAFVGYLLVPIVWIKILLVGVVSVFTASWYPTLRAKSFQAFQGRSGVVMAVGSAANLSSLFVPLVVGRVADWLGLGSAIWLLAIGPLALIIGLPQGNGGQTPDERL